MKKIVIMVSGGLIVSVYGSPELKDAEILIHDEDLLKEEGIIEKMRQRMLKQKTKGLIELL